MGHVTTVRDEGERTFWEVCDRFSRWSLREHPLPCPPNKERRDLQTGQSVNKHLALANGAHKAAEPRNG